MIPFIKVNQYNFIKQQTQVLINANANTNHQGVRQAVKSLAVERAESLFTDLDETKKEILKPIANITDRESATLYLATLNEYIIPFQVVTDQKVKKLFPKAKKLKLPKLSEDIWSKICYLGWDDAGTNKRYIVIEKHGKVVGVQGTFKPINQKGVCTLCNQLNEVGMFTSKIKGEVQGTFVERGNYMCKDMQQCNENVSDTTKLENFIDHLK